MLSIVYDLPPQVRGPAPYPPEWQWTLREGPTSGRFGPLALAASALFGLLAATATPWARAKPRRARLLILTAAMPAGFAFSLALLGLEPGGVCATLVSRTTSASWSSFYGVAGSPDAADPIAFLDRFAELLPRLPKHAATHPPGPVLYYRGLIALLQSQPRLTRELLKLEDAGQAPLLPHARHSQAAAFLGAALLPLLGVAAAWPVSAIAARVGGDERAGARAGVLWTLLPGPALFVPKFDHALALPVAGATALLLSAAEEAGASVRLASAAGLLAGISLFVSYGSIVFLAMGALAVLAVTRLSRQAVAAGLMAAAVAVGLIAATAMLGHQPLAAARMALAIHRQTYTLPRSYALWLPFDLLDLTIFLGPPVAALFAWRATDSNLGRAAAAGLALLLLSGVTRGEVGRLWIPLMPLLLVAAVTRPRGSGREGSPSCAEALGLGVLLLGIDIALRVRWVL